MNRAPGISSATSRPSSTGTSRSPLMWVTSVGTVDRRQDGAQVGLGDHVHQLPRHSRAERRALHPAPPTGEFAVVDLGWGQTAAAACRRPTRSRSRRETAHGPPGSSSRRPWARRRRAPAPVTRPGWVAAYIAHRPRSLAPNSATRSSPTSSSTASRSSICCSSVGGVTTGSDSPVPRRSNITTWAKLLIRSKLARVAGSSHISSRCDAGPLTITSGSDPSPHT